MSPHWLPLACVVLSGATALVYEILWTRVLGFAFGTSTEAIGTVLAVFFGGMALGNWLAARHLERLSRPLRVYGWLELGIGLYALLSWPALRALPEIYGWVGADHGPLAILCLRLAVSALILLPPTVAMGATIPVVARGFVARDSRRGRESAYLYGSNTLGAVLGAYLCGYWLIPGLGLTHTVYASVAGNLVVAGLALWLARRVSWLPRAAPSPSIADGPALGAGERRLFYALFALSGFVAIGYEIVWSKVFGIVMEGTLYGFATVLSAYLLGIAIGSFAISGRVDRISNLRATFGALHLAIAAFAALGMAFVGDLPFLHSQIAGPERGNLHTLYLVAAPIVLIPTALFGAAFPVLIRLCSGSARAAGEGIGRALAVNTAGSIAASLSISFVLIDRIGIDASFYLLVVVDVLAGLCVVLSSLRGEPLRRLRVALPALVVTAAVTGLFDGVHIERAVMGHFIKAPSLETYHQQLDDATARTSTVIEGRTAVVTILEGPKGWTIQNNGLPESRFWYGPPYRPLGARLLAVVPYLAAESPERALVVGFGGGGTVDAMLATRLQSVEVVELERGVIEAIPHLYRGRPSPLDDRRVRVRVDDARNHLLLHRHRGQRGYDLIASQPSHPWLLGAANLFTEDFFEIAREALSEGGTFAVWVNGFHTDRDSVLAILTSFERVFPGSWLLTVDAGVPHSSFMLVGSRRPLVLRLEAWRERLGEPLLRSDLALHEIHSVEDLLVRIEGPTSVYAALHPELRNTDDSAIVETRLSRLASWDELDFAEVEAELPPDAAVLPDLNGELDLEAVVRAALPDDRRRGIPSYAPKLERLLRAHGASLPDFERELLGHEIALLLPERADAAVESLRELAARYPERAEPWRALGRWAARKASSRARAVDDFAEAWARSGEADDALRALRASLRADPTRAAEWLARLPSAEAEAPEALLARARLTLDAGAPRGELRSLFEKLRGLRQAKPKLADLHATLARLAYAAGELGEARRLADLDWRERNELATPLLEKARHQLASGEEGAVIEALERLRGLVPGDSRVAELAARLALKQDNEVALAEAFEELRRGAPDATTAVTGENVLRARLGLPLLPPRGPEELADLRGS
jgi:spermidine synthase